MLKRKKAHQQELNHKLSSTCVGLRSEVASTIKVSPGLIKSKEKGSTEKLTTKQLATFIGIKFFCPIGQPFTASFDQHQKLFLHRLSTAPFGLHTFRLTQECHLSQITLLKSTIFILCPHQDDIFLRHQPKIITNLISLCDCHNQP